MKTLLKNNKILQNKQKTNMKKNKAKLIPT